MDLIEYKSKEEIFKLIEEVDKLKSLNNFNKIIISNEEDLKKYRSIYSIGFKNVNLSLLEHDSVWSFLHKTQNLIDLQDFLLTYDHHKLINKAKISVKDKDTKKIENYFEKFYLQREKKYKEIFRGNLEDNDLIFLETEEYTLDYKVTSNDKSLGKDYTKFPVLFEKLSTYLKSHFLNFLDIHTVGKFSMCSKSLNNFVNKTYNIEKLAKFYCLMIYKNHNLYKNDEKQLKLYKNYFEMYKNR